MLRTQHRQTWSLLVSVFVVSVSCSPLAFADHFSLILEGFSHALLKVDFLHQKDDSGRGKNEHHRWYILFLRAETTAEIRRGLFDARRAIL